MKKLLGILVLGLLLCNIGFADVATGRKYGKGPLKVTKHVADILEYYFSGGRKGKFAKKQKMAWKPGFIVISSDGREYDYYSHPLNVDNVMPMNYVGQARKRCKKRSGKECFVFASNYKIVWDNGSDKSKRRLKRKDIKAGKTLQILQELGFYDGGITQSKSKVTSSEKKDTTSIKKNDDIVQQIKDLKELHDSGVLTKEEFEKAKKKLLN